jgi:hypothetical protein
MVREMVYHWGCRHCDFSTWSPDRDRTAESAKSHLLNHYEGNVRQEDFGLAWSCPYCDNTGRDHDGDKALAEFKNHLFSHVEPLLESGVHLADGINGTGSIMIRGPTESPGADNARIHLLTPADIYVFVTTTPKRRIELIRDELSEWPAWTVLITTKSQPLAGVDGIDLSTIPMEVVQLDKALGLSSLGETVSRVLSEHESAEGKISLEFDILPEVIAKFDVKEAFRFLHIFTSRCDRANALSHYYVNPKTQSESSINVLSEVFDMEIEADGAVFTSSR